MTMMLVKAGSLVGSLLLIVGLVIALLKGLIGFIAFLSFAVKLLILLAFVAAPAWPYGV